MPSRIRLMFRGFLFSSWMLILASHANAAALQCQHLPQLFDAYFRNHYSHKAMTDELRAHTIEQFIKSIDPSKTLLIEEDVSKLRKDLGQVFGAMQSGNCKVLDQAYQLIVLRAKEDEEFAKTFL